MKMLARHHYVGQADEAMRHTQMRGDALAQYADVLGEERSFARAHVLTAATQDVDARVRGSIDEVNSLAQRLATLNDRIATERVLLSEDELSLPVLLAAGWRVSWTAA